MVIIEFLKNHIAYRAGDVAHFPDEVAHAIVAAGVAKLYSFPAAADLEKRSFVSKMVKKSKDGDAE